MRQQFGSLHRECQRACDRLQPLEIEETCWELPTPQMEIHAAEEGNTGLAPEQAKRDSGGSCLFKPLNETDAATVKAILKDTDVRAYMSTAWRRTMSTGNEHGFFIYRYAGGYHAGPTYAGGPFNPGPGLFNEFLRMEKVNAPVASFHTHPGTYAEAGEPSFGDYRFADATNTISLIMTRFGSRGSRMSVISRDE